MELTDQIEDHFRLIEAQKKALKRLGLITIEDLLYHFPTRYENIRDIKTVSEVASGDTAILYGTIDKLSTRKAFRRRTPIAEGTFRDDTGTIKVIWFHQPYLAKMLVSGSLVKLYGKITGTNSPYIANPEVEQIKSIPKDNTLFQKADGTSEQTFLPVYPESRGITSKWMYHAIGKIFTSGLLDTLTDPIDNEILSRFNLPKLTTALIWIHTPRTEKDSVSARKRFSFEEVFLIQLAKQRERHEYEEKSSFVISVSDEDIDIFVKRFPFTPTNAQDRAIKDIVSDFKKEHAMGRLLEGDVGSGKTAVAAATAYAIATTHPYGNSPAGEFGNLQTAYMVPTEILAKQHFESFIEFFGHMPINIGLITGSGCKKFPSKIDPTKATDISRAQLLKWVANGEIPILIGTHALIQKTVKFENLAYVIIDEQHRFGVNQRMELVRGTLQTERRIMQNKKEDKLLYKDITYRIREALFSVHKELGVGHKESVYQNAVSEEFNKNRLKFNKEVRIPIKYRNKNIGVYIPDFVVEDKIIVELKALPFVGTKEKKQLWSYLKGSDYKLAMLVNFGTQHGLTIDRIVYDTARAKPVSASSPQESAFVPHFLSMTATPIPRTLALTVYGDLDLTLLDEMPKGRKPVITEIVLPNKRVEVYKKVEEELLAGRQAYVICPRIDEPDPEKELALNVKSVKEEAKRLSRDVFPDRTIEILHSKIKPKEKEEIMERFLNKEIDILVATSVIEVGVNVPNATVIIIEGGERFGLAQLHQLRGRVLRSTHQSHCFVFADTKSKTTLDRLKAFKIAKNGFALAEEDLKLRGPGELYGRRQWGISDIGMEAMKNIKMVEVARKEAGNIIEKDLDLSKHPTLKEKVEARAERLHFE
jgi:ATP-dependent DNA helicase RecG|tara:strand:- start:23730 stop:26351 length:2622 start_codon:yes stop_codon:yes gene_type:complete